MDTRDFETLRARVAALEAFVRETIDVVGHPSITYNLAGRYFLTGGDELAAKARALLPNEPENVDGKGIRHE